MHHCRHPLRHSLLTWGITLLWLGCVPLGLAALARSLHWSWTPLTVAGLALCGTWAVYVACMGRCRGYGQGSRVLTHATIATWTLNQGHKR
jgi:hypothetical protein